jgi:hypothetical protein
LSPFLAGALWLLVSQCVGEGISRLFDLPMPGPGAAPVAAVRAGGRRSDAALRAPRGRPGADRHRARAALRVALRRRARRLPAIVIGGAALAGAVAPAALHADDFVQLDPFAQATRGYPQCPEVAAPKLAPEQARHEAHVRVERGLRCAMEGKCEPGGAYKRDPGINEQVRAAIAGDARFADTSVWLTTTRRWVTLQGCVHGGAQRKALVAFVAKQPDVERVFDELATSAGSARTPASRAGSPSAPR